MGVYQAAEAIFYFGCVAAALGTLMPSFGATFLLAAAYAAVVLFFVVDNTFDPASVSLLWLVLFTVSAAAGLIGHNAGAWALRSYREKRRSSRRYL